MKNTAVILLLLFALPLVSSAQELDWEVWGMGLGLGEIVRVGDTLYSDGTFKQSIGHNPVATITRHGVAPKDSNRTVKTTIMYALRGIASDEGDVFWGLAINSDIYRINASTGSSTLVARDQEYGGAYLHALVQSNRGKLYYMDPNLVEVDPEKGTYRTVSGYPPYEPNSNLTVRPLGLTTLSNGGVAAVVHVNTKIVHEFSTDVLDTLAIMFVRSDGSFREPVVLSRDGFRMGGVISMNDMPNGDLLLSTWATEEIEDERFTRQIRRIIHYRFDTTGTMVATYVWDALDYLWSIQDIAVTENGQLIAVGSRNRGNHGTSSLMFRADLEGNLLWSRDEVEFHYGVAQLDRVFRWNDGRFLLSATTNYRHPDGNYYDSWLGLFNLDGESGVTTGEERALLLDLR